MESVAMDVVIDIEKKDESRQKKNVMKFKQALDEGLGIAVESSGWLKNKAVEELFDICGIDEQTVTRMDTSEFIDLLVEGSEQERTPPQHYFVQKSEFKCHAKEGHVEIRSVFTIVVIVDKWVGVPLFSRNVALSDSSIEFQRIEQKHGEGDEGSNAALDESEGKMCLGVHHKGHFLIANRAGRYVVRTTTLHDYSSKSETGMKLLVHQAKKCEVSFTVPRMKVQMKVDPAINERSTVDTEAGTTTIACVVPPTTEISIQWASKMELEVEDVDEKIVDTEKYTGPPQFTYEQCTLYTYSDEVLGALSVINYKIDRGALSKMEIILDEGVQILDVEGLSIRNWDVAKQNTSSNPEVPKGKGKGSVRILRVYLEYGIEDQYTLMLSAERGVTDMAKCEIFRFTTTSAKRAKGYIAVLPRSSVELQQVSSRLLAPIDSSELPSSFPTDDEGDAKANLLYPRKFLSPDFSFFLKIIEYKEHSVLVAVIETAHFLCVYTEEGSLIYKLILKVHNSQKQYVRIAVPDGATIWSATINGAAVKPAKDAQGNTLIQLDKSSTAEVKKFTCSIMYKIEGPPFKSIGSAEVMFPKVDIPINSLAVTVYLPERFNYGEFKGDIDEIRRFSYPRRVPDEDTNPADNQKAGMNNFQQNMNMPIAQGMMGNFDPNMGFEEDSDSDFEMDNIVEDFTAAGASSMVIPLPTTGEAHYFEVSLVTEQEISLRVGYRKSWRILSKRRLHRCTIA